MPKLLWLGLVASVVGAGCLDSAPDGTYAIGLAGDTCSVAWAKTITFAGNAVTLVYATTYPMQSSSTSNVVIDGNKVTFDATFYTRNSDTYDGAGGDEHYVLKADGNALTGTLDGSYSGSYNGHGYSCTSTLTVTGTRS